jgi:hypothetical protein
MSEMTVMTGGPGPNSSAQEAPSLKVEAEEGLPQVQGKIMLHSYALVIAS